MMLVLIVLIELLLGKMTAINSIRLFNTPVGEKTDPMWTPGCWRGWDNSSDTEKEDTDSTQLDVITKYNQAMACLSAAAGVENPPLLTHQIINWESASEKEKNVCIERASEACLQYYYSKQWRGLAKISANEA